MKTVVTRGPIGAALNAIRRELVRLKIQSSPDVVSDETPRGTNLSIKLRGGSGGSSTPTSSKYEPFIIDGTSTYFITPWHHGLCGPVIQIGDRSYRGFLLTGGSKVILATVKIRAYAGKYPVGQQDPDEPEIPPSEFYNVLGELVLSNQASGTFNGEQVGFTDFSPVAGFPIISENFGSFITQRWFFPVRLEQTWNEYSSRIGADEVVNGGETTYIPQPGQDDNPWDPRGYFMDFEVDVPVGFLHQETAGGPYSLDLDDAMLIGIGGVPLETDIGGISGGDQRFGFWHSETQIIPVYAVPQCPPQEGFVPWEPYGFTLANRDAFGYPTDSEFPGKDQTNLLRNDYPRKAAFMLPFGSLMQSSAPNSFRQGITLTDMREIPPNCV